MNKKLKIMSVAAVVVVLATVAGTIINWSVQPSYMLIFTMIGSLIMVSLFIVGAAKYDTYDILDYPYKIISDNRFFFLSWLGLVIAWLPAFLAYYPVLFNYDVINQYTQILTGEYNQHHPIVHTLLCQLFWNIGLKLENVNLGFALYALFQMLSLSAALSYGVVFLRKMHVRRWIVNVVYIWCAIFVVHPILALSITKDTMFSIFALLAFLLLFEYSLDDGNLGKDVLLCLSLTAMILFRNNAKYAVMVTAGVGLVIVLVKKKYIRIVVCTILALVAAVSINSAISIKLDAQPGNIREMLCVPTQQIARVYVNCNEELLEELNGDDIDLLYRCCSKEFLEQYHSEYTDYVKLGVNSDTIRNNKLEVLKLYIKIGIKHPKEYLGAFFDLTQGYWYLGDVSHAHIYDDWAARQGYLLTDMKQLDGVEVEHKSKFELAELLYEKIATDNIHQFVPIVSILFVPAFYIMLFVFSVISMKKTIPGILAVVMTFAYFLTVLMGPGCVLRYSYSIILCAVFMAPVAFIKEVDNE